MRLSTALSVLLLLIGASSCSRDPEVVKRKYVETGNKYFEKGKYKEASIMYRSALNKDRRYGEAYYRLGLAHIRLGQIVPAAHALRRAVELQPKNEEARARLADIYLMASAADRGQSKELVEDVRNLTDEILKLNPNSFDGLRLKGHLAWRAGDLKGAIENLQAADKVKPFDPNVVLALSQVMAENNQFELGEELAKQLIEREKDFGPIYDVLYLQYARRNRMEDAERVRRLKVENNPTEARYILELAQFYRLSKRDDEVAAVLNRMLSDAESFPDAYRDAGDFYARARRFDKAMEHFREGSRRSEGEQKLLYEKRIADVMVAQGRHQEAARHVETLLKEHPEDAGLQALRASLLLATGTRQQIQAAVGELEASVARMPANPVLRFHLGLSYWAKDQMDLAETQFGEAIRLRPDYVAPRLALAQVYLGKREWGAALQAANEVLKLAPSNLMAALIHSNAVLGMGRTEEARKQLLHLAQRYPKVPEVLFNLGRLEMLLKNHDAAEETFRLCHERTGEIRCVLGMADAFASRKQFDRAIELVEAERAKKPESRELKLALANVAVLGAKYDLAISLYQEMIARDPQATDLQMRLGHTYRMMGKPEAALEWYRKARDLEPRNPAAHYPVAILLDSMGRRTEAIAAYEQVLKLSPDNPIALNNLAYILAETGGDLDQALTYAQRAKQKMPQSAEVSDTLGWIYLKKNLTSNALEIYRELVAQRPDNSTFRYHLAMALLQRGDKPQAKKELQTALRSNPSKEEEGKIRDLIAKIG